MMTIAEAAFVAVVLTVAVAALSRALGAEPGVWR